MARRDEREGPEEARAKIQEDSLKRLSKEITEYEREAQELSDKIRDIPEGDESFYAIRSLKQQLEETVRALESARQTKEKFLTGNW